MLNNRTYERLGNIVGQAIKPASADRTWEVFYVPELKIADYTRISIPEKVTFFLVYGRAVSSSIPYLSKTCCRSQHRIYYHVLTMTASCQGSQFIAGIYSSNNKKHGISRAEIFLCYLLKIQDEGYLGILVIC